jgi:hypothetical protein
MRKTANSDLDMQAKTIKLGDWDIKADGTSLSFYYNGTKQFKLGSNGLVTAKNDVVAFGTP